MYENDLQKHPQNSTMRENERKKPNKYLKRSNERDLTDSWSVLITCQTESMISTRWVQVIWSGYGQYRPINFICVYQVPLKPFTWLRAVPLKNPRVGKSPPPNIAPPRARIFKKFRLPRPQLRKDDRPPPPPDSLLSLRPPTPRLLGLFLVLF